ncbi:MAG: glycosyltransferase [Niallia nealsonii]|nr:glycosyltransferase [Niallia nealsonii]
MIELSIIIPIYNADKYLDKCISSVLCQTYKNFELILIDDGSSDTSLSICQKYQLLDKRVRLYHQENNGPSSARNVGIDYAKGEYIAFIDADDYITEDMYTDLMSIIKKENCDLVISPLIHQFIGRKNKESCPTNLGYYGMINNSYVDANKIYPLFENGIVNGPCGKIYKASFIKEHKLRMPDEIHYGEDLIFNIEYLHYCNAIYLTDKAFYYYVKKKSGSLTTSYTERLFYFIDTAHDKTIEYFSSKLNVDSELERNIHFFTIHNVISSFTNLFDKDCTKSKKEKKEFIRDIVNNQMVKNKIDKAHKPGVFPFLYKAFLQTRFVHGIYYTCKYYRFVTKRLLLRV